MNVCKQATISTNWLFASIGWIQNNSSEQKKGTFFFIQIISKVKNRKIQFKFSMPKKSQAASLIWSFTNVDRGVVSFAHKC